LSSVPSRGERYDWEVAAVAGRGDDDVRWLAGLVGTGTVLELACGTGRIARPLADRGATVVGLDIDPQMLAAATRHPRVHLVRGDMRRFAFAARFDVVAIPYNGLQLLLDDADRLACLRCAAGHLAEGGVVAFEVTDFLDGVTRMSVPHEPLGAGTVAGVDVVLHGGLDHDVDRRVTRYRRRFLVQGHAVDDDVALYSFAAGEIEDLLQRSGLSGRASPVGTAVTRWVADRLGHPREPGG
jgi:SAM-dependent methyltransferase